MCGIKVQESERRNLTFCYASFSVKVVIMYLISHLFDQKYIHIRVIQAVRRWLLITEPRLPSIVTCEIRGQSGTVAGLSPTFFGFSLLIPNSTIVLYSYTTAPEVCDSTSSCLSRNP
jgi:hypothetical protein